MELTLQECIDKIKKEYPRMFPYSFVEVEGKYAFNLIPKGQDPDGSISDMHVVDPKSGYVSGGISIMEFLKNPQFRDVWKKANLVSNHDESIGHSSVSSIGWKVRRKNTTGLGYENALCHHGIKGQHWGISNGPPYPLNKKEHDKVIQRGKKEQSQKEAISQKTSFKGNSKYVMGGLQNRSEGSETEGKKKIPKAAIVGTVALVSFVGLAAFARSKTGRDLIGGMYQKSFNQMNTEASRRLIGDIADLDARFASDNMPRKINGEHSAESDMAAVNPRYMAGILPGTSNNCFLCSCTYDLRRRGYDVTALSSETGNVGSQLMKSLYKGGTEDRFKSDSFGGLFGEAAKKYPEGSRGLFNAYGDKIGHTMAWEIHNGQLTILDTQRNTKVSASDLETMGFNPRHKFTSFIRTDNLEVKPEGIGLVCAQYKSDIDSKSAFNGSSNKSASSSNRIVVKPLSDSERRRNYEELWKKEHPNAANDAKSRRAMENWIEDQLWGEG